MQVDINPIAMQSQPLCNKSFFFTAKIVVCKAEPALVLLLVWNFRDSFLKSDLVKPDCVKMFISNLMVTTQFRGNILIL